jgi:adenine-specific DNA-methyltransferase
MSKEQKITNDIKVPNKDLEALRLNFPHCFDKDGNFQLEKFKNNLTEKEINFSTESYGLEWLGKSYARLLASDPATTLLKADETHNSKPENANSENLLIKGDNLEVLKHLANAYYEQVKMIYIDPPYNTGSDGFIYEDDRKFTIKELQNLIGVDAEKAKRILDFTKQKSNSHSAWLTFLYPRLYTAKQLLKDDGVIFISLDDSEIAQLRLLMDEVFGEENFVANICWKKRSSPDARTVIGAVHDWVVIYKKIGEVTRANIGKMPLSQARIDSYLNPDNDKRGQWASVDMTGMTARAPKTQYYDVELPSGRKIGPPPGRSWGLAESTFHDLKKDNRIWFGANGDNVPRIKKFLSESEGQVVPTIWDLAEVGSNDEAKKEINDILEKSDVFDTPKPTRLLKRIIQISTNPDSLILDFFAGSGSTGDAVVQLNAEDGGNRKFLLVQIPEPINPKKNKSAYDFVKDEIKAEPTIFEITKERLIRASKRIKVDIDAKIESNEKEIKDVYGKLDLYDKDEKINQLKSNIKTLKEQDLGFKVFETTPIWEDYNFEAEQFDSSQTLFDAGKLTEDDIKVLLTTWKTYDGIALTQDLENVDLNGYNAYYGNNKLYLMNKGFNTDHLKALLEKIDTDKHFEPKSIIAFGYHLESKSLREISENVKTYNNKKKSDIDFITRY